MTVDSNPNSHSLLRMPLPLGEKVTPQMQEMYDFQSRLFNWRKDEPVLHWGKTMHFISRDNTYAFFRYNDTDKVFVYVNNSPEEKTIPWSHYAEIASGLGEGVNVVTGEKVTITDSTVVPASTALVVEY